MKRKVVLALLGATALCMAGKCTLQNISDEETITIASQTVAPVIEQPRISFRQIEVKGGIIFKEEGTGQEIFFEYDEPEVEKTPEPKKMLPKDSLYYIIEEPLEADPQKRSTRDICEEVGKIYQISPEILEAMCWVESNCQADAFNGVDRGIIQVSKRWHYDRMQRLNVTDLADPYGCILVAADFLMELKEYALSREDIGGDIAYVLMRYNMHIESAEELYAQGIISKYATKVLEIASELEKAHGK